MFETADEYLLEYANSEKCNKWIAKVIRSFLRNDSETYIYPIPREKTALYINEP